SQTRTFCFVEDNISACEKALEGGFFINDVVNIGNDVEISVLELAKKIIGITGSTSKIVYLPPLKEGDMTRRQPDISKMKQILNRPLMKLDDGIVKLIEFYKANPHLIEN
ncbi:MAG TPA: epimerase, partial [Bacteroidia bacterium]|nr:epimerase [Bacteroidia bacterium]